MSSTDRLWLYIQIGVAAAIVLGFIIRAIAKSSGGGYSTPPPPSRRRVARYERRAYKQAKAEIDEAYWRVMRGLK